MPEIRFFRRAEVWAPTLQGWACVLGLPAIGLYAILTFTYPFLHVNDPQGGELLVVEGWMNRNQLASCSDLVKQGQYQEVVVTGGEVTEGSYMWVHYPDYSSVAEIAAEQLRDFGLPSVHAVARPYVGRDRTYASALALRKWLVGSGRVGAKVDVVSSGPHSRRSWMLFRIALQDVAEVGVIALDPTNYDPRRWWTTSSGVRAMIGELLAYGYAKFLFYPNPQKDVKKLLSEGE